ncbi:hypothetical protein ACSNN9_26990 [Micromonospora sp. URMC 107]|uniref:hypothetical protein n=1 Tax=Micromonospora sp. URMC 107 TaxID=3423418 RepID=UPI003F1E3834
MDGGEDDRVSFLNRWLPSLLRLLVMVVDPGTVRTVDPAEWGDAIVVLEYGQVEVEYPGGGLQRFGRGDVLWFDGLAPLSIRNLGSGPAVLAAVSRNRPA